jgi:MarR family transcriptional regulator, organic hydroperoxide resistance regulator
MIARYQGGFLVSKVKHVSERVFERLLKKHNIEINPAQGRILFVLWNEDSIPIQTLAQRSSLSKSTLTSMLDRLEAMGYIRRRQSEADRRVILIARTDKDRALEKAYRKVSEEMTELYYDGLSDAEIRSFERTLARILDNLLRADAMP